jgi:hypothetical protein
MAIINLAFTEGQIPMGYKMRINEYLATIRSAAEGEAKAPAGEGEAAPASPLAAPSGEDFSIGEAAAVKTLGDAPGAAAPVAPKSPAPGAAAASKPAAGGKP